jgi:hypothetical protein
MHADLIKRTGGRLRRHGRSISSRDLPAGIFSVPTDSRLSDVQPPVLPIFPVSEASPTRMRKPLPARSSAIAHSSHTSYSTAFGDSISQAT